MLRVTGNSVFHGLAVDGRPTNTWAGGQVILQAGDMLEVPAGVTHYAKVVGNEPVVFIDASRA